MTKTAIYVMTHKKFDEPTDSHYIPLQVGREGKDDLGYLCDNTGDNISDQNCYFSELTGHYFVWKNIKDADIVGTCHYRRYLLNSNGYVLNANEINSILNDYDLITTKAIKLNYTYYDGFAANHKRLYLDETERVIADIFPDYIGTYRALVHSYDTYFGNMLIAKKALFNEYMEWLFAILFELQKRVEVDEEDSYHRRIFGFISEFLQYVWVQHHKLKAYTCKVGMIGEKAEIREVKNVLRKMFADGDTSSARSFFLEQKSKRPDLMMEASDITGELHLCMEIIAIAGLEERAYSTNIIKELHDYDKLIDFCNTLNNFTIDAIKNGASTDATNWFKQNNVTNEAKTVAYEMFKNVSNPYQYIPR